MERTHREQTRNCEAVPLFRRRRKGIYKAAETAESTKFWRHLINQLTLTCSRHYTNVPRVEVSLTVCLPISPLLSTQTICTRWVKNFGNVLYVYGKSHISHQHIKSYFVTYTNVCIYVYIGSKEFLYCFSKRVKEELMNQSEIRCTNLTHEGA